MQKSSEQPLMSGVNIVLLGKTGAGKSASGNTIIGVRETFKEDLSPESVTRTCESAETELDGQTITVIDTVGLPDTSKKITDVQTEIEQIFDVARHGVDVFLLVIKLGEKFTDESRNVVKWIQENFGAKLSNHTIVLFTHGEQLSEHAERYLSKRETLRSVVGQCSGGFHVFNNKDIDRSQVTELLEKINTLRVMNKDRRYTERDYKKTQDEILQRKCLTGAAVGGVVGGLGGAVGGGMMAAKAGVAALAAGGAVIGAAAAGAALAAAAAGYGVHFLARKYISKSETRENKNKKQK